MHTKDKMAEALRKAGLTEMADKAAAGYYHDYLSPLTLPATQFMYDIIEFKDTEFDTAAKEIVKQFLLGEFDASDEEAEEWAKTPEGIEANRMFHNPKREK